MWSKCACVWSRATGLARAASRARTIRSASSPGSMTTASPVDSSARIVQLHCSGPTGNVSTRGPVKRESSRMHGDDRVHVVALLERRIRPDLLRRGEIDLHGPLVVVGAAILGREELAAAARREDLPPNPAEVEGVAVEVEGGNLLARLDRRL